MDKLKIAQVAPVAIPVRPAKGDSIEQLVSLLTEELVRRGHDVTLFAVGDSETTAELRSIYPRGYREREEIWDWRVLETLNAASAFEQASEFDVMHSHTYHFALPFTRFVSTPVVHTYHVQLGPEVVEGFRRYSETQLVAISEFQRSELQGFDDVPVIHNGIDAGAFPFRAEGGDYLAFLGRMIPSKGAAEAVRIARELDLPLIMAGPSTEWFERDVRPAVDDRSIRYLGPVDPADRNELLAGAAALLYPITYPEPFGLVMVEAMACGTPVAAFGVGAVPEVVEQGVGGCWVPPNGSLGEAVRSAVQLDRRRVREAAVERFDYRRMVDAYERLYRRLARPGQETG
jgi:glycosyltransferase involved in cell wall biosynthesis